MEEAWKIEKLRSILEWETPEFEDLEVLSKELGSGRVRLLRLDSSPRSGNLKKPVVAALILRGLLLGRLNVEFVRGLVDAGNMNMGLSLRYYCRRFGLSGDYFMSRFFPDDMIGQLESEDFRVMCAPARPALGVEGEFYFHLLHSMRRPEFRGGRHCLWHAKHGNHAIRPLGREVGASMNDPPDCVVVTVGSGATLSLAVSARREWRARGRDTRIVVAEHELTPIVASAARKGVEIQLPGFVRNEGRPERAKTFREPVPGSVPHAMIGPHFDDMNPFLSRETLGEVDEVTLLGNKDWQAMSLWLMDRGWRIGNSSAANVAVAASLARKGLDVLAVVVEPLRDYYLRAT